MTRMGKVQLPLIFLGLICLLCATRYVESAKILCASHQFPSHMAMVHSTVVDMIPRGHEVYTIFSDKMSVPKGLEEKGFKVLRYHTPDDSSIMADPNEETKKLDQIFRGKEQDLSLVSRVAYGECVDMDNDLNLEKKLQEMNFDIAVLDMFVPSSCLMVLPLKLKIPFVLVPPVLEIEYSRVPLLPSFYPFAVLPFSDNMSFMQRLKNTLITIYLSIPAISQLPSIRNTTLLEKYNDDPSVTTWSSLGRKAELHMISRGGMVDYPIPMNPNVINIECLTCKPGKPLSEDIQQMVNSSEGMIVITFGSLITRLPDETAQKFLTAFAKRKELVFWRYSATLPGNVPSNVKIMKWLPQNDLLAHPKTKLFITHAGNNGQYESVYHGVPMLAFPLFAEQHYNAHRTVANGFGLESNILTFTAEELGEKIDRIISDPSFRTKTQHAGRAFKSLPMSASETASFWIEHVLEFGSDHLKSHALNMPWYSFYLLDVLLTIELILIVIIALLITCFVFTIRKVGSLRKEKIKTN